MRRVQEQQQPLVGEEPLLKLTNWKAFFDSLAMAAATGKTTLDELVNTNSTLTSFIVELAATNT